MSIIRVHRPRGYTVIPDLTLRDPQLQSLCGLAALGLLVRLLSRPDGWEVYVGPLAHECGIGRDALRGLLALLEKTGYLARRRARDARGRWSWQSEVYDTPQHTITGISGDGGVVGGGAVAGESGDILTTDTSTTDVAITDHHNHSGGEVGMTNPLYWPRLHANDRAAAEQILMACPATKRQEVLDVLSAAIKDQVIARASPIPYLSALAAAATGAPCARQWDPSPGYPVARQRARAMPAAVPQKKSTPDVALAALAATRAMVGRRRT